MSALGTRRRPTPAKSDPLAPVEFITSMLLTVSLSLTLLVAVIAGVQLALSGSTSVSIAEIGSGDTCVVVPANGANIGTFDRSGNGSPRTEGILGFRGRVASYRADSWEACLKEATTAQYWAARIEPVGQFVFGIGSLLLIRRFIKTARRRGLFTEVTASVTRQLGWFLLVFGIAGPLAAAAGRGVVVSAAVKGYSWHDSLFAADISLTLVVAALGVLTMARVLSRAVPLQEEVDATV